MASDIISKERERNTLRCYVVVMKLEKYDANTQFDWLYDDEAWEALVSHKDASDVKYSSHDWDTLMAYKRILGVYEPKENFFRVDGQAVGVLQLVLDDSMLQDLKDYLFNCECEYLCMQYRKGWTEKVAAWLKANE